MWVKKLGANVCLTASKIIDVTGETPVEMKGYVPARSVVIPGSYTKSFQLEIFKYPVNYWYRKPSTDLKHP
jgi:2,3,4,5-tetrahydropyridine-2-carboxylate N-succinyltransferase